MVNFVALLLLCLVSKSCKFSLRRAFESMDINGDRRISIAELQVLHVTFSAALQFGHILPRLLSEDLASTLSKK